MPPLKKKRKKRKERKNVEGYYTKDMTSFDVSKRKTHNFRGQWGIKELQEGKKFFSFSFLAALYTRLRSKLQFRPTPQLCLGSNLRPSSPETPPIPLGSSRNSYRKNLFYYISLEHLTLKTLHLLESERRSWGGSSGLGAKCVLTWAGYKCSQRKNHTRTLKYSRQCEEWKRRTVLSEVRMLKENAEKYRF